MKTALWRSHAGPFGLSMSLHALLLLFFVIGFGATRASRPRTEPEIVQARIVEDKRLPTRRNSLPAADPQPPAATAPPTERPEQVHRDVPLERTEADIAAAARQAVREEQQRKAREQEARHRAEVDRERALQERKQREQMEAKRAADQEAERRQTEQRNAAKAAAEVRARVQAEAEAREAKLRSEARRKADDQAKAEQAARARAEAEKETRARAKAEAAATVEAERAAKLKAEASARMAAEKAAKAKADAEAAARAKAEAENKARLAKDAQVKAEKAARAKAEAKRKAERERLAQAEQEQSLKEQLDAEQQEARLKLQYDDAARRWLSSRIEPRVESRWLRPPSAEKEMTCIIAIRTTAAGQVIAAQVTKSSGDPAFDRSAEAAVRKASPLPMPPESKVAEKFLSFSLKFKP